MQQPVQSSEQPVLPTSQMPVQGDRIYRTESCGRSSSRVKRRHGRCLRFIRGYLMIVGGLTTLYVLMQLVVLAFIEIGKYISIA